MDLFSDEIHDEISSNLIETFLTNYTRQDFLKRYINVLLYQGDFGTISSDSNTTEIIDYFKEFVRDITSDIKNYNFKIVKKNVFDNYTFISNLLEIKEDSAISVGIGYDNVLVHYNGLKTETSILLNDVIENKIQNLTEFRKEFNFLYSEIQIFNQFKILRPSVTELDKFVSESNNYSGSIINWLKEFNNIILKANNNMSDLSVLKKEELADNYFLFSDLESVKDPIERIVNFLTTSYRTYKTGYNIFDDSSIIDSSSLTIIAGPTNHSKSIFSAPLSY